MRCPKCQYISFDAGERCRNCGYEFSLTVEPPRADLPITTGDEAEGPLTDLSLSTAAAPASQPARAEKAPLTGRFDLPLFKDRGGDDDAPLVTPPAVPRAPLAVRKSTPVITRTTSREKAHEPELDLGSPEGELEAHAPAAAPGADIDVVPASIVRRLFASAIDLLILGSVNLAVLYFTLRLCGLQWFEVSIIPAVPFLAYVLLVNAGYFVAFLTAGGQTIGKMAASIKVIPADSADAWSDRVSLGAAVVRTVAWMISVIPAGLGLLPAVFSQDRRALHDRLSGTRVVSA